LRIATKSAEETVELGERLGKLLKPGDVIALSGDLGAGKTTLTRGIAQGMGVQADIHSPTFTLIHEHPGPVPLYHIDLYRLSSVQEAEFIGIDDYIYSDGVTIIEWAETIESILPRERLDIQLNMTGDTDRELVLHSDSPRLQAVIEVLQC
jgi:tRNA threonylcarbamoyladenosine biosynthesis protein TsaE